MMKRHRSSRHLRVKSNKPNNVLVYLKKKTDSNSHTNRKIKTFHKTTYNIYEPEHSKEELHTYRQPVASNSSHFSVRDTIEMRR